MVKKQAGQHNRTLWNSVIRTVVKNNNRSDCASIFSQGVYRTGYRQIQATAECHHPECTALKKNQLSPNSQSTSQAAGMTSFGRAGLTPPQVVPREMSCSRINIVDAAGAAQHNVRKRAAHETLTHLRPGGRVTPSSSHAG
ncbi:hypothetical protein F2P81_005549 [Scophthalmus maximus]|uniref:Uncharacterized protein n=1 Tax=Scophthalmus maximus TaxID=52904 RepID=A0A6A4T6X7_SCOMX|nr:hypothetical protein F2P81_005549 [Scophthalmus maximus]